MKYKWSRIVDGEFYYLEEDPQKTSEKIIKLLYGETTCPICKNKTPSKWRKCQVCTKIIDGTFNYKGNLFD